MLPVVALLAVVPSFSPEVHRQIAESASQDAHLPLGAGAIEFVERVHERTDRRGGGGDKSDGRLYLHHIEPVFGYAPEAHAYVRRSLDLEGEGPVPLAMFVELSTRRAFAAISAKVKAGGGSLSARDAAESLYMIAVLLHAAEDEKHGEGNWSFGQGRNLTSLAHFTFEIHHLLSDVSPSNGTREQAALRSSRLLTRLRKHLLAEVGVEACARALSGLASVSLPSGAKIEEFRPRAGLWRSVFPSYPRRSPAI